MVKKDLFNSILLAIVGVLVAYFSCNMFIGEPEEFSFKTVESSVSTDLANPDPEVFNYNALNPTVETYVGNCSNYNEQGECIDADQGSK